MEIWRKCWSHGNGSVWEGSSYHSRLGRGKTIRTSYREKVKEKKTTHCLDQSFNIALLKTYFLMCVLVYASCLSHLSAHAHAYVHGSQKRESGVLSHTLQCFFEAAPLPKLGPHFSLSWSGG